MPEIEEEKRSSDSSDEEETESEPQPPAPPPAAQCIATPNAMDILCGRGKSTTHPGNQRFRKMILDRKDEYQKAKRRDDKTRITLEIVHALREEPEPSRFLLKDPNTDLFFDVGELYAREKVSHALRSRPNEERCRRPKQKRRTNKKPTLPVQLDVMVERLIRDQQQLLKSMISKDETIGGRTTET